MDHEHYTPEEIIEAVKKCKGYISKAAAILDCDYSTITNYRKRYPEVDKALNDLKQARIDRAEEKLDDNIEEGKEKSIIFFLRTQARDRGYVDKQEHDVVWRPGEPVEVKVNFNE